MVCYVKNTKIYFSFTNSKMKLKILLFLTIIVFIIGCCTTESFQDQNSDQIPRIIHHIVPIDDNDIVTDNSFKTVVWNKEMIDKNLKWSKELRKMYDIEPTIKGKKNIASILILNQYGGIYIDQNICEKTNLKRYIEKSHNQETNFFAFREPNLNYLNNRFIGSTPKHPVLRFMIDKMEEMGNGYQEIREKMPVDLVTGMGLLSKADIYNYHITLLQ
jgi:mannosyltransferase OCH1-like enzyme